MITQVFFIVSCDVLRASEFGVLFNFGPFFKVINKSVFYPIRISKSGDYFERVCAFLGIEARIKKFLLLLCRIFYIHESAKSRLSFCTGSVLKHKGTGLDHIISDFFKCFDAEVYKAN